MDRHALRWNGWGRNDRPAALEDDAPLLGRLAEALGIGRADGLPHTPAVDLADAHLPESRLPAGHLEALRGIVGDDGVCVDRYERAFHALGQSYQDLLRARAGELGQAPDAVVYPGDTSQTLGVVRLCAEQGIAVIPFGGGSSVVGGVNALRSNESTPVISLDTTRMCRLLSIDVESMTARAEAGIYGPALEAGLAQRGLTLGHYPQSFQFSTLGGWIAARGAGQQSNRYGKAEAWLAAATLATPGGMWSTDHAPASAAGPDLRHLVAGSEGTMGVICEASFRVHASPACRDYRGYLLADFAHGVQAIREINLRHLPSAMMRLSDPDETHFMQMASADAPADGLRKKVQDAWLRLRGMPARPCLLLIGLEGDPATVRWARRQTGAICRAHGALPVGSGVGRRWFENRFNMPFLRDPLLDRGIGVDTLETAIDWAALPALHGAVREAIARALDENSARAGARHIVMAHVSHSYADGASLYFTFVFERHPRDALGQWQAVKRAACDAIVAGGGTISHHHGVGIDHAPWLVHEKGALGLDVIRAARAALDPTGVMNPGKLLA